MPIPMLHNHHMLLYIRILRNYFVGTCALEQPMLLFVHWGCSVKWRLYQESLYWLNGQKHSWPIVLMQHRVGDAHACLLQSIHRKAVWLPRLCLTFHLAQLLLLWLPHVGLQLFGRKAYLVEEGSWSTADWWSKPKCVLVEERHAVCLSVSDKDRSS